MKCSRPVRRVCAGALVAIICASVAARLRADGPPNILADNRDNHTLEALETVAFNAALTSTLISVNPLALTPYPVFVNGRVLSHPKIHNLYLDSDWDANNPGVPTMSQLDAFTQDLVNGPYLTGAQGYGVQSATFTGSHGRSAFCIPVEPEDGHAEFVELLAWVTCEVSFNPANLPPVGVPGLLPPITGVPQTDDDTLYVIYLPPSMNIIDSDCPTSGYHFFGAAPNFTIDFSLIFPVPTFYSQTFAYAVVPTKCALENASTPDDIRNNITAAASHEIVEAATDPLVGTGWINNSVITDGSFFSNLVGVFSNVSLDLKVGEAGDNCELITTQLDAPVFGHPTSPVSLKVDDAALNNQITVAPYWSNKLGKCVPDAPTSKLTFGFPNYPRSNTTFVTSNTFLTIDATEPSGDPNFPTVSAASLSYRSYPSGTTPPAYTTGNPHLDFRLAGSDGTYTVDFFATSHSGIDETSQTASVSLDDTAPAIAIVAPAPIAYSHADTLTLAYSATDGSGSGVQSTIVTLDGSALLTNLPLSNGRTIDLLTELTLGPHSFALDSQDHVTNDSNGSVAFSIVVTADGIKQEVNAFLARGKIRNAGLANSLLAKLGAAAAARTRGQCQTAANVYGAFISELQSQSGNGVDAAAAGILINDAQYLIGHCS